MVVVGGSIAEKSQDPSGGPPLPVSDVSEVTTDTLAESLSVPTTVPSTAPTRHAVLYADPPPAQNIVSLSSPHTLPQSPPSHVDAPPHANALLLHSPPQVMSSSPQGGSASDRDAKHEYILSTLMSLHGHHPDAVDMRAAKKKSNYPKFKIIRWVFTVADVVDKYLPLHPDPAVQVLTLDPWPESVSTKKIAPTKKVFGHVFGHTASWVSDCQRAAQLLRDPAVRSSRPDLDALLTRLEGGLPPAEEDREMTGVGALLKSIGG